MSLLDTAKKLIDLKLFSDAEKLCYEIIGTDKYSTTDWAHAWHLIGIMANLHGKYTVAEEAIKKAIQYFPIHPGFFVNLGNAYQRTRRPENAESAFRQAVALDPRMPDAHFSLANCLFLQCKYEDAIDEYLECIRLSPDNDKVWINLGSAYKDMGARDRAQWAYDQHLARNPDAHGIVLRKALTFSPIWQSEDEAEREFEETLRTLKELEANPDIKCDNVYLDVGAVPFYTSYTGRNTKELQETLGRVLSRLLPAA